MQGVWRELLGQPLETVLAVLPARQQKAIGRWVRGREEYRKLKRTDHVLMSWGKSGRTWLRVMLSRFYQVAYGIPEGRMLEFDNLHRIDLRIPSLFFTHSNYLRDYTGNWTTKEEFYEKRVLMLVRDPRDVAVSQYYQWQYRMRPVKKLLNDYPPHGADVSLFDFVMDDDAGLPKVIEFFEIWQRELPKVRASLVVRYEEMRADPGAALGRVLEFLGTPGSPEQIAEAVAYASYDNMKRLEQDKVYWLSGSRLAAGDPANPQSYKVRRAKVGGWRDDFTPEQAAAIDALLAARPLPPFGYGVEPAVLQRASSHA
jgi:Sulfotransferase domain